MKKIVILGCGPSGLIVANYLKQKGYSFKIVSSGNHGFIPSDLNGIKFSLGQRTLFANEDLYGFLVSLGIDDSLTKIENLNKKIGVLFEGKIYDYPIQNNFDKFTLIRRLQIYISYLFRNKNIANSEIYAQWVRGNYGNWLADNVILPHTYKTLKEDLFTIYSNHYGKKVVKLNQQFKFIQEFIKPQQIMEYLFENVKDYIINKNIGFLNLNKKNMNITEDSNEEDIEYDILINTVALPKFLNIVDTSTSDRNTISVAKDTLRWNNMLIVALLVPTDFINTDRNIIYFPERQYLFSKVYFQRLDYYTIITCEISYRENDKRIKNNAYLDKIYEIAESDLKKSQLIIDNDFVSYDKTSHLIQPAYIICDKDYECNNIFIQHYLEHNKIYNIGRFSEWKPNLRVEDSVLKIKKLVDKGTFE